MRTTGASNLVAINTNGPISSSPAVANGVVYVGSDDFNVYAINAITGASVPGWPFVTGGSVDFKPGICKWNRLCWKQRR